MKLYLTYGAGIAVASSLVVLVLFALGYHNDPGRFQSGQNIDSTIGFVIPVVGLIFGIRKARETSPDGSLSYGRAVATGAMITLAAAAFSAAFTYVYGAAINPEYHEIYREIQTANVEAAGLPPEHIDQARRMVDFFSGPLFSAVLVLLFSPVYGMIVTLLVAAFLKRSPGPASPPPPGSGV